MKKLIVLMLFLVLCFTGCGLRLSKDVSRTMSNLESNIILGTGLIFIQQMGFRFMHPWRMVF